MHKLLQQFAREPLPKGDLGLTEKMHAIADRFQQLPMYFLTFHGGSDVDQVLEAMDYAGTCNDCVDFIHLAWRLCSDNTFVFLAFQSMSTM